MDLLAACHPFFDTKKPRVSPPGISDILSSPASEIPPDSWHIGFSRAGDLLYFSDNAPDFFRNVPTLKGLDTFMDELGHWVNYKDFRNFETFRTKLFTEARAETVVRTNRVELNRPPMLGIASRKHADGYHLIFVTGQEGGANPDIVLKPGFFQNEKDFLKEANDWLERVDEETLAETAVETFKNETASSPISTAAIRSLKGDPLKLPANSEIHQIPQLSESLLASGRWWGSVIEDAANRPRDYWIHTSVRCGRVLPVVTLSVNTGSIKQVGVSFFSCVLAEMSEKILGCAKSYTGSPKFRYAKYWKGYEGYDFQKAETIIELVSKDSMVLSIIPIHTTSQDLHRVSRKIRLDEPYFWDERRGQVWVVLRNTTVENAELMARPSLTARLGGTLVGPPQTIETFILKYCHG
jgi:hypothetical protein